MTARIALVTGSARGIGRAIAEALTESGHVVVGVDVIDQDAGPMARVIQAGLGRPRDARPPGGRGRHSVDVLVNNAAILVEKPIEETSVAEFDLTIAVNLRAPFLLSRAFGAGMRERGWGGSSTSPASRRAPAGPRRSRPTAPRRRGSWR